MPLPSNAMAMQQATCTPPESAQAGAALGNKQQAPQVQAGTAPAGSSVTLMLTGPTAASPSASVSGDWQVSMPMKFRHCRRVDDLAGRIGRADLAQEPSAALAVTTSVCSVSRRPASLPSDEPRLERRSGGLALAGTM